MQILLHSYTKIPSFNSLQTGMCISSTKTVDITGLTATDKGFNSLQTGKWISRLAMMAVEGVDPKGFNSLQTGKWISRLRQQLVGMANRIRFQFPSNGKVYLKKVGVDPYSILLWVSIPFKRESGSQAYKNFYTRAEGLCVSIPFKRESVSQVQRRRIGTQRM